MKLRADASRTGNGRPRGDTLDGMEGVRTWERLRAELTELRTVFQSRRRARVASVGILLTGGLLVVGAVILDVARYVTDGQEVDVFSLSEDGSIPELYGYVVSAATAVLLLAAFGGTRTRAFLLISAFFGFVVLDDALEYHETIGGAVAGSMHLSDAAGLRAQDLGELLSWAAVGVLFVPLAIWCLVGRTPADMGVYVVYGAIIGGLLFFAVGVDMAEILIRSHSQAAHVGGWIEDGGELVMMSCAAACAVLYQQGAPWAARGSDPVHVRT